MPQIAQVHFAQAVASYRANCYAKSARYFIAGLKADPCCVEAHADLAKVYEKLGCWDLALAALSKALELRPNYAVALRRQQRILEEKQLYKNETEEANLRSGLNFVSSDRFLFERRCDIPKTKLATVFRLLDRIYEEIGEMFEIYPEEPISIVMENCEEWLRQFPDWSIACYDGDAIRICYRPRKFDVGILKTVLSHEWVHLMVDRLCGSECPAWLDEGLAMAISRPFLPSERQQLGDRFLEIEELENSFSQMSTEKIEVAYLQSHAMVSCLLDRFEFSQLRQFLQRLGDGDDYPLAFEQTFGEKLEDIFATSIFTDWLSAV